MNSAANQPITATTRAAMPTKVRTMNCGMARMKRKATVSRFCCAVPANHISTRHVGATIAAPVMTPPL